MDRALDDAVRTFEQDDSEQAARDLEKIRQLQELFEQLVALLIDQSIDELVSLVQQTQREQEPGEEH